MGRRRRMNSEEAGGSVFEEVASSVRENGQE
jgi:hypothetical protein